MTLRDLSSNRTPKIRRKDWRPYEFLALRKINGQYFYYDDDNMEVYPFTADELNSEAWEEYHDKQC